MKTQGKIQQMSWKCSEPGGEVELTLHNGIRLVMPLEDWAKRFEFLDGIRYGDTVKVEVSVSCNGEPNG